MSPRARIALVLYGALGGVAVLVATLRGDSAILQGPAAVALPGVTGPLLSIGLGLVVAGLTVASTRVLVRHAAWARHLHGEFRALLGRLAGHEVLVFAVASGISEELLFRGALQPILGLVPTALLFGVVHVPPRRSLWPWTMWAAVMGVILGAIFWATGELIGAIVAHVAINFVNLRFIRDTPLFEANPEPTPPFLRKRVAVHGARRATLAQP